MAGRKDGGNVSAKDRILPGQPGKTAGMSLELVQNSINGLQAANFVSSDVKFFAG